MNCPFCGYENIPGADNCESCEEDLTAFDGLTPRDKLEKGMIKDNLLDVAKCASQIVSANTPIWDVAQKMDQDNNCSLVTDGENLIGIVTVRDILQKAILKPFDIKTTPISEIMTPNPDTLNPDDKIVHALNHMAVGGYRHIPIKIGNNKYQVISVRDIIAYLAQKFPKTVSGKSR